MSSKKLHIGLRAIPIAVLVMEIYAIRNA